MKNFLCLAMASALATAAVAVSCNKTEELSTIKCSKITSVDASIGSLDSGSSSAQGSKVISTDNNTTLGISWAASDNIYLFSEPNNTTSPAIFTYTGTAGAKSGPFNGSITAINGKQIYAIHGLTDFCTWTKNGVIINLTQANPTNLSENSGLCSVMYAGALYTGSNFGLTFKQALAVVRIDLPLSGKFRAGKIFSADGSLHNCSTLTLSPSSDPAAPNISWSANSQYGTRILCSYTTDYDYSSIYQMYFMLLPMQSAKGLTFVFTRGGVGNQAIDVKYVALTDATKKIESGMFYRINSDSFNSAALVNSSTAPTSTMSAFWYCKEDPSSGSYLSAMLKSPGAPANITVVADGFTSVPSALSGCTKLKTFIDNSCSEIPESMFSGCTNLENISLANTTKIGVNAFTGCTSIKKLVLNSATTFLTTIDALTDVATGPFGTDNSITQNIDLYIKSSSNVSGNVLTLLNISYTFKSITEI